MFFKKISIAVISSVLLLMPVSSVVNAATFTSGEINQIQHLQKEYTELDKTKYSIENIYQTKPRLKEKFSAGSLKDSYINSQIAYINYYRSLFGLYPVTADSTANNSAQKTAAVMAAINANPFVNQHGLPADTRPNYVSKSTWKLAQSTSQTSNLNFNVTNQSAGDVITDLLTDHYNLTGSDTGHRAWLLSTRLSTTGVGAVYGNNGYRYSVQKVLNVNDIFRTASQPVVTYPNSGVFPIELIKGKNIAWSIYFSNKTYSGTPIIEITDNDTRQLLLIHRERCRLLRGMNTLLIFTGFTNTPLSYSSKISADKLKQLLPVPTLIQLLVMRKLPFNKILTLILQWQK